MNAGLQSKPAASELARGWMILIACFLGIALGMSSLYFYSLGIFIKPMAAEFGWSRGDASLGGLVGTICGAIMAVPTGRLVDRLGSLRVALVSLALLATGFLALGFLTGGLGSFLVITAMLALVTAGSGPLPFTRLVVSAFHRQRGIALGIVLSGTGIGAILIPQYLSPFVATHGWRAGYQALAVVILLCLPLLWWLLARAREDKAAPPAATRYRLARMLRAPAFRLLGSIFFLAAVAILGTVVQFVPMLSDWGLSPAIASFIGVAAIVGRLVAGLLLDRFPAHRVTIGLLLTAAVGLALLGLAGPYAALPGALIVGLAVGIEVDLIAFLVGRLFARTVYGQVYGAVYAIFLLGGAVGPTLSGYLKDVTGDYRAWLLLSALLLTTAAWLARRIVGLPAADAALHSKKAHCVIS